MLENKNLSSIGKIYKDPRITPLGRLLRKYWIDELPQIYDLLLGKIKLLGIRAMSYPFFDKYPEKILQHSLPSLSISLFMLLDRCSILFDDISEYSNIILFELSLLFGISSLFILIYI